MGEKPNSNPTISGTYGQMVCFALSECTANNRPVALRLSPHPSLRRRVPSGLPRLARQRPRPRERDTARPRPRARRPPAHRLRGVLLARPQPDERGARARGRGAVRQGGKTGRDDRRRPRRWVCRRAGPGRQHDDRSAGRWLSRVRAAGGMASRPCRSSSPGTRSASRSGCRWRCTSCSPVDRGASRGTRELPRWGPTGTSW